MSSQQKNLVYALWQEVSKLEYTFWTYLSADTCKPVFYHLKISQGSTERAAILEKKRIRFENSPHRSPTIHIWCRMYHYFYQNGKRGKMTGIFLRIEVFMYHLVWQFLSPLILPSLHRDLNGVLLKYPHEIPYPGNTTTVKKRIFNVSERLVFSLKCRVYNGCIKVFSHTISVGFQLFEFNYFPTETKPHKQPLKNPTFQPKPNHSEMF